MERKLTLDTGEESFIGVFPDRKARGLVLVWMATSMANVTCQRLIVLRLGWPPIQHCEVFVTD